MAEIKTLVKIGKEYKDAFNSLHQLLSRDTKLADAIAAVNEYGRKEISTPTHVYVYSEQEIESEEQIIAMGVDGASWFAPIRQGKAFEDKAFDNGMSDWKQLISKVATNFHKKYSIIEYKECTNENRADAEKSKKAIRNIVARLFGEQDVTLSKGGKNEGTQDIYGAHVKLELGCTGQAYYTVMCKIYFRRTVAEVRPISAWEASIVNAKLEQAKNNDEKINVQDNVIDDTLNALNKLVNGEFSVNLKDCLCFGSATDSAIGSNSDQKSLEILSARAMHNSAPITCTSIKVLSISHVKWVNDSYDVIFRGKPILRAVIGFGGSISMRCINCENFEELISSNEINYSFKNEDGATVNRSILIDPERDDLGIDEQTVNEIILYSEFSNHLKKIICKNVSRLGKPCSAFVCHSQTIRDAGGKNVKCANCPYPEVVYTDFSEEMPVRYFTSTLKFAVDKMAMVPTDEVKQCVCCGRPFTASALEGRLCPLCSEMESLTDSQKKVAKKKYAKYRNMLGHFARFKHLFHAKYCLEDDTTLLFALGEDRYVFSKLDLAKTGYVDAPDKINRT